MFFGIFGFFSHTLKYQILARLQAVLQPTMPVSTSGGTTIIIIGGTSAGAGTTPQITELPNPLVLRITAYRPAILLAVLVAGPAGVEWTVVATTICCLSIKALSRSK
jgi:hypothetical protein